MGVEDNDGRSQNSGLVRRRIWTGMPPFMYLLNLTEPAAETPIDSQEPNLDQAPPPAEEVVLLGEEPRTIEG